MTTSLNEKSKFVSYVLRHKPEAINLSLDREGWAPVADLLAGAKKPPITMDELEQIVREDEKGRYSFNEDHTKIRANQGHSTSEVRMTFAKGVPPVQLFHGADISHLQEIYKKGLLPMARHHVHLSKDLETAMTVGGRRRKGYVVLIIDAKQMLADGIQFFISENGVWLVDHVPPKYLSEQQ